MIHHNQSVTNLFANEMSFDFFFLKYCVCLLYCNNVNSISCLVRDDANITWSLLSWEITLVCSACFWEDMRTTEKCSFMSKLCWKEKLPKCSTNSSNDQKVWIQNLKKKQRTIRHDLLINIVYMLMHKNCMRTWRAHCVTVCGAKLS